MEIPGYDDIKKNFDEARRKWAQIGGLYTVNLVRDQFLSGQVLGRRTGTGVRSIQSRVLPDNSGFEYGTNVNYMVAWEQGFTRKSYVIEAVRAKALAFQINGQTVFAKRVTIPEQPFAARPFLAPAGERAQPYLQDLAEKLIGDAVVKSFPDVIEILFGEKGA